MLSLAKHRLEQLLLSSREGLLAPLGKLQVHCAVIQALVQWVTLQALDLPSLNSLADTCANYPTTQPASLSAIWRGAKNVLSFEDRHVVSLAQLFIGANVGKSLDLCKASKVVLRFASSPLVAFHFHLVAGVLWRVR